MIKHALYVCLFDNEQVFVRCSVFGAYDSFACIVYGNVVFVQKLLYPFFVESFLAFNNKMFFVIEET